MPLLNRYNLTPELIAAGHEAGALTRSCPLREAESIEEEAQRLSDADGNPRTDRVLDVASSAIAVSHQGDLPFVLQSLFDEGLVLAEEGFDLFSAPTAEGFYFLRLLTRDEATGFISELQLHTLDMLQARDVGIGGHAPVQVYHQRLRALPAAPEARTSDEKEEWQNLWSRIRHAFWLALQAEQNRAPRHETDAEKIEWYRDYIGYLYRRTLWSGTLRDAKGAEVEADRSQFEAGDFAEMQWPRVYLSAEHGVLEQAVPGAPVVALESGAPPQTPAWHPADLVWCGVMRKEEADKVRQNTRHASR